MSTITREQLIEKLKHRIAVTANYPDVEEAQLDAAIFKIAMASLEADPVAFIGQRMLEEFIDGARSCGRVWPEVTDKLSDENRIPLYTAPPAPVSDEDLLHMAASAIDDLLSNKDRSGAGVWADIPAKLRRAAMLQGAENAESPSGNSPVIPDGWVDCSERMPEEGAKVLVIDTEGNKFICWHKFGFWADYRIGGNLHKINHWMTLPAAPQQEVK